MPRIGWLFPHLTDEPDASAGNGSDELLLFAAVSDRTPRGVDPVAEGRFRDDPSIPNRRQEIILADDVIPIPDQVEQKIEHLRLDRHQFGAARQLTPVRVESMIAEQVTHSPAPQLAADTLAPTRFKDGDFLKEKSSSS